MMERTKGRNSVGNGSFNCGQDSREQKRGQDKLSLTEAAQMAEATWKGGLNRLRPNLLQLKNRDFQVTDSSHVFLTIQRSSLFICCVAQ